MGKRKNQPPPEIVIAQWADGDMGFMHKFINGDETYLNARCLRAPRETVIEFLNKVKNGDFNGWIAMKRKDKYTPLQIRRFIYPAFIAGLKNMEELQDEKHYQEDDYEAQFDAWMEEVVNASNE